MSWLKLQSLIKREWTLFHQLRTEIEEEKISEDKLSQTLIQLQERKIVVTADVIITPDRLDDIDPEENLKQTQKILSDKMGQPVELQVRVFPIEILNFEAD